MLAERDIRRAALEMNKVMTLDPPLDIKVPIRELVKEIWETVVPLITPEDKFSEKTQRFLSELTAPPEKISEDKLKIEKPIIGHINKKRKKPKKKLRLMDVGIELHLSGASKEEFVKKFLSIYEKRYGNEFEADVIMRRIKKYYYASRTESMKVKNGKL